MTIAILEPLFTALYILFLVTLAIESFKESLELYEDTGIDIFLCSGQSEWLREQGGDKQRQCVTWRLANAVDTPYNHDILMPLTHIAPVNTLLPELLSSIFISLVNASAYARLTGDKTNGSVDYPTLLSSVCAHWRRIAICTPYLWSDFNLMNSNHDLRNLEPIMLWLERSRDSPLHIRIGQDKEELGEFPPSDIGDLSGDTNTQIAFVLRSCGSRLRSLVLKCYDRKFAAHTLSILQSEKAEHSMRELFLGRCYGLTSRAPLASLNTLGRLFAPFHVLHLESVNVNLDMIPCRNLTDLRLIHLVEAPSESQLARLCASNPGLHSFVLHGVDVTSPLHTQPIELPSLRILDLSMGIACLDWFFRLLVPMPEEISLYLGVYDAHGVATAEAFENTLALFCQRARVKLLFMTGEWQPLTFLLKPLPQLERLRLHLDYFHPGTVAEVKLPAANLPKLHNIELVELHGDGRFLLSVGLHALLSLPSVQQITCRMCDNCQKDDTEEEIRELMVQGGIGAKIVFDSGLRVDGFHTSPFY